MCALSQLLQSNLGWQLLDFAVSNEQNHYREDQTANSLESLFVSPPSFSQIFNDDNNKKLYGYDGSYGGNQRSDRKLCHNASERDRRKKLNSLYSSLRSLLPASDQRKNLSIPATVARVVTYIPELQQELERLSKKRDEIQRRVWRQEDDSAGEEKTRRKVERDDWIPGISVTRFSDKDVGIQISAMEGIHLSDVLMGLEEFGLCLVGASSFVSCTRRVFYNLHFEMEGNCKLTCEELTDTLLSLYDKKDELLPQVQAAEVRT